VEFGGITKSIINSGESVENFHNWSRDRTFKVVVVNDSLFFKAGFDFGGNIEGEAAVDRVLDTVMSMRSLMNG